MIPAKADPDAQAADLQQKIEPRLAEARAGQRTVFLSMPPTSCGRPSWASSGR
jgi:hypothetical protein